MPHLSQRRVWGGAEAEDEGGRGGRAEDDKEEGGAAADAAAPFASAVSVPAAPAPSLAEPARGADGGRGRAAAAAAAAAALAERAAVSRTTPLTAGIDAVAEALGFEDAQAGQPSEDEDAADAAPAEVEGLEEGGGTPSAEMVKSTSPP